MSDGKTTGTGKTTAGSPTHGTGTTGLPKAGMRLGPQTDATPRTTAAWAALKEIYGDEPFIFAQGIKFGPRAIEAPGVPDSGQIEHCTFNEYGWDGR